MGVAAGGAGGPGGGAGDLAFEEELLRDPFRPAVWLRYLGAAGGAPPARRRVLFERALRALPGSYKLWRAYLLERREVRREALAPAAAPPTPLHPPLAPAPPSAPVAAAPPSLPPFLLPPPPVPRPPGANVYVSVSPVLQELRGCSPRDPRWESLCACFERALVTMHRMPRIWLEYVGALRTMGLLTRLRRAFDRALRALPPTQHGQLVWPAYLDWVQRPGTPTEVGARVYRRYLKIEPGHAEEYVAFLQARGRWGDAARALACCVDDPGFFSLRGRSRHQLWIELCDLVTAHPRETRGVPGLDVEAVLRSGIAASPVETGALWASLADFFIRGGNFERARDVYAEAMAKVGTVRDFTVCFDACTAFEESVISALIESGAGGEGGEREGHGEGAAAASAATRRALGRRFLLEDSGDDLDLRLSRLEALMEDRPLLLNSVLLRQNPNNCGHWHKRAELLEGDPARQIGVYTEAVRTVDAAKAEGRPQALWTAFARLYEAHGDLDNARTVFRKAFEFHFASADDLAQVWCEAAEMELRHKRFQDALELMRECTDGRGPLGGEAQASVARSLRAWTLRCDLEESLGSPESARAAYGRTLDLRVATPQLVLNFSAMLREGNFWEESFRVFERGLQIFRHPHSQPLWEAYLAAFVERYGGRKLERARDLFEQALKKTPPASAAGMYAQYARLEEEHGLASRALTVLDRAARAAPLEERWAAYQRWAGKAAALSGVAAAREVFEAAVEREPGEGGLPDAGVRKACMEFARLEKKLGEVDRARAILQHGSRSADPRADPAYWAEWNNFEVQHGNEETFREMLRVKRSVAAFHSQAYHGTAAGSKKAAPAAAGGAGAGVVGADEGGGGADDAAPDSMAALERQALEAKQAEVVPKQGTTLAGFVSAGVIQQGQGEGEGGAAGAPPAEAGAGVVDANPEDIDLGDEGDDEDGFEPAQKAVPAAVFGGLGKRSAEPAAGDAAKRLRQ